jgi:flagellar M-ring protein FliF
VTRQLALLFGLAASIAIAIGMVQWVMTPTYKPLYGAMAPEDTNDVISSLEANGIDYSLDRRSGMVAVPAGQLQRARMLLASDGFPRGEGVGFESLYREQEIGLSSFMEQARFQRALEWSCRARSPAWTACAARACTWPWPSRRRSCASASSPPRR